MGFALDQVTPVLQHNSLMATLKRLGYSTVAYESLLDRLSFSKADVYFPNPPDGGMTPFQQLLLDTTALRPAWREHHPDGDDGGQFDYFHFKRSAIYCRSFKTGGKDGEIAGAEILYLFMFWLRIIPFVFAADGSDPGRTAYGGFSRSGVER